MFEKLDFPNRITVEITNRCNVSCVFCPRQKVNMELGDMNFELYKKIIDEAAKHLPIKLVIFFRGEPLLYENLEKAIKYAKEKGIGPIQFTSNALALDENNVDMLLDSGVDFVSFSLDTIDAELYKKSRLYGDLNVSSQNVINFAQKCKQLRAQGKQAPTLQVSTIEIDEYMERQQEFIDFWKAHVDIVRIYYEHDEKGHIVNEEIRKQLVDDDDRRPCRKIFTDFLVYWNGKVALCNYDWLEKNISLNVKENSISEIWNSKEFEKIRNMHYTNNFEEDIICKDCHHWKIDYTEKGYLGKVYTNKEENE